MKRIHAVSTPSVNAGLKFQNFTFVIYSTPKVVPFTVDLHKDLIKVPLLIRMTACLVTSSSRNL